MKKITLHFPLGLEVSARNMKGVTIKDALDAIHKQFKKRVRSCFCNIADHINLALTSLLYPALMSTLCNSIQ